MSGKGALFGWGHRRGEEWHPWGVGPAEEQLWSLQDVAWIPMGVFSHSPISVSPSLALGLGMPSPAPHPTASGKRTFSLILPATGLGVKGRPAVWRREHLLQESTVHQTP